METKLRIINELEKDQKGIHLRELSRLVKSGLPNIKRFMEILEKEGVIKKEKDANLVKFRLKEGYKTVSYLKQLHTERFLTLPSRARQAITDFINAVEIKPLLVLIFGSYAKCNYNKESDIDILLVFQRVENESLIENNAKRISMRTNVKLSPIYVDYKSFENNFLNKEHDFSKEIRGNVIIIWGVELYYSLLWRFLK